jgi:rubredoxin
LHGVFGVCGVKNNNNRVYNKKNYGMMVEALQREITEGSVLGELEHPTSMNIDLNKVSHKIESIEMNEDGTITGTIVLLDTAKGRDAQAIAKAAGSLYISSRGAGSIDESGNVNLTTIKTYDLVGTPGFSQAKLNLKKGQTLESLNESLEDGNIMYAIIDESSDADDLLADDNNKKEDDKKSDDKKSDDEKSDDKKYKCLLCGYIYDDSKESVKFEDLNNDWGCPICGAPKSCFEEI